MNQRSTIGIFDSGLGGLTVAKRVLEKLPRESIVYFADQAHVPYGEKSPEEIRRYALGITDYLIKNGAKLVIMACNMSSATALREAIELFSPIPVIGVIEAGARSAISITPGGPIGVLATTGTVNTGAYRRSLCALMPGVEVIEQACPKFVPIVEAGISDTPEAEAAVREYTEPLLAAGCRTLILGCTHYPFLLDTIRRVVGSEVRIVDPALETVAEAADIMISANMPAAQTEPIHRYITSGCSEQFSKLGGRFLGVNMDCASQICWGTELGEIECQEKMVGQTTKSAL